MVLVSGIEVATSDTEACLEDLLKAAKIRPRSAAYNYVSKKIDKVSKRSDQGKTWIEFSVATELFSGFKFSKQVASLAERCCSGGGDILGAQDPQFNAHENAMHDSPSVEQLIELSNSKPNDANVWLYISDTCLNWSLQGEHILHTGLKKLVESAKCEQRVPYILNMVEFLIQTHPQEPYRPLELVTSVLASGADLDSKETHCLDRLALYLFQNCITLYEPIKSMRLETIASLPVAQQHQRALVLAKEYRQSIDWSDIQDEKLYFVSRLEALMERYFVDLPRQDNVWTTYSQAWAIYVEVLESFGVESEKIYAILDHLYRVMPQYARDNLVGEYSRLLAAMDDRDTALRVFDQWVQTGKTSGPEFTKRILRQHVTVLLESDKPDSQHQALWPYLERFSDNGEIWGALVTLEYHIGTQDTAHQLAELGLEYVQGATREHIWQAYLQDAELSDEKRGEILARYASEFQTKSVGALVVEFLGDSARGVVESRVGAL